ncbi:hypothetical protein CPB83DRAFT_901785 [Crepidotus variabilis]|uniref:Ubiquitin-like-conjugating enzyme ATG10 n=1 Tax=Crepidotus variabilis TaxID=179855 RepID=A0A9P6ETP2_9AGAR|nr:hypothetical protein CPB83DRAFT_901785 [Crepidotus variabilis]
MFTRDQFERACQVFAKKHSQWKWASARNPGYGYLMRTTTHMRKSFVQTDELAELVEDLEEGVEVITSADLASSLTVNVVENIVYCASFSVPAFYFAVHNSSGAPLPLNEIIQTSFFKISLPKDATSNDFALTVPSGSFPLLSQGDHPTLGAPWWYFHPCETDKAVGEFMKEEDQALCEDERLIRWMEIWLMIVGNVLNV